MKQMTLEYTYLIILSDINYQFLYSEQFLGEEVSAISYTCYNNIRMKNRNLTLARLNKEEKSLDNEPIQNVLVKRKGVLNFHFCIYNLDGVYQGGFYHGVLELAEDYPFSPPKIKFFTPSGRYQVNKYVCTTFTNFHKEQWSTAWNVRSLLTATVSFVTGSEGGTGWMRSLDATKRSYAAKSLQSNMQDPQFVSLFKDELEKKQLLSTYSYSKPLFNSSQNKDHPEGREKKNNQNQVETSNTIYFLILMIILVIIGYAFIKKGQKQPSISYKTPSMSNGPNSHTNVYTDQSL